MAYTKTVWTDELPAATPIKYKMTDDTDGVVAGSAIIEVLTSVTAGTPVNAANLNHLETGVYNAQVAADAASTAAGTALSYLCFHSKFTKRQNRIRYYHSASHFYQ